MFQRNATITGALLAIGSIVTLMLMPRPYAREILAIVLAGLGGFYAGLGLAAADPKKFSIQAGVSVIFVALSLAGLWLSPRFLALGFLAHAGWDTAHHPSLLNIFVPAWYVPTCLAYDILVGLFILAWW